MDIKSFSEDTFNPKDWLNNAYRSSDKSQNKLEFLESTLSALEVYMQQLNNRLEESTAQVISGLPRMIRESQEISTGASALRTRATSLEEALKGARLSADHPLPTLQRTDALKARLEAARQELLESDKWATLTAKLEAALESGKAIDISTTTKLLTDMNECLEILSGCNDYEDKRLQLEGLKNRLEAVLSPSIVENFTSQNTEKCKEFWKLFVTMGRRDALSVYRARCEDGALRARLPSGLSTFSPSSLRDLHAILLRHAAHQLEWAPTVCPGEETLRWIVRLFTSVIMELTNSQQLEEIDIRNDTSTSQLDQLGELLSACDHFVVEMMVIINNEQEKKGTISDSELQEFAYVVYTPARNGLKSLSRLLVSVISDDIGSTPKIEPNSTDAGTLLQLRVGRGLRSLTSRINQGKILSRGSAPEHLLYSVQWLIDELCAGWTSINNLFGCLSLMKAAVQLKQLATQAEAILYANNEEYVVQLKMDIPKSLQNWNKLLKANFTPLVSSVPLHSAPDKLSADLKQKALNLVLAPISTYLDYIDATQGWVDNDQHTLDLPDFSLSPQEYITQVGQYLMNLPQHLEPLLERGEVSTDDDPAYQFLNEVCNSACEIFATKIITIGKMDALGIRKCKTDIAYLCSVLEELEAGSVGVQRLNEIMTKIQRI